MNQLQPAQVAPSIDAMVESLSHSDEANIAHQLGQWSEKGVSTARMLAAILQARDRNLQAANASSDEVLERFDRIQARWLRMLEDRWLARIQALELRLAEQGQAGLLQEARTRWLEAGQVDLYTYYEEMPLVAQVNVVSMREHGFSVSCTPDLALLIAGSEQRTTAYLQLPGTAMRLKLVVEGTSGRSVHFREDGLMGVEREHRRHIRVTCREPIAMKIRHEKGPKWNAAIHDMSAFGFGLVSEEHLPWSVGKELLCKFSLGERDIDLHGTIRWKTATDQQIRMGMELPREHPFVHRLQMEVADRQQQIITGLKKEGCPQCLLEVPVSARIF